MQSDEAEKEDEDEIVKVYHSDYETQLDIKIEIVIDTHDGMELEMVPLDSTQKIIKNYNTPNETVNLLSGHLQD